MSNKLKIVICSYKANTEFKLCLNQIANFGFTAENLQIYENSPVDYTFNRDILDKYRIPYIDNPGGTHAETMNRALLEVETPYALLLDSDCFLRDPVAHYLQDMEDHKIQLMGEICGDRGGFHIHKRVHPWWCLIDMNFIREHKIQFVDFERIRLSHSESFVITSKLADPRDRRLFYYDAGSTMYEDVINNHGIAADIGDDLPYVHVEGASWRRDFEAYRRVVENQDILVTHMCKMFNYEEANLAKLGK